MDDDSVQPVIATILMVAITVVVAAAILFGVFQTAPDATDSGPTVSGIRDERQDTWIVTDGSHAPQSEFSIRSDAPGIRYAVNGDASATSPLLGMDWVAMTGDSPWPAGTKYSFCADGAEIAFRFQAWHNPSNGLALNVAFSSVKAC